MIVTFSIENFLSFNEEETFSMVASNRFSDNPENHLVPIPGSDAKVLRGGVLYGANGAGKSNFFKALSYLQDMVLEGREKGSGTGRTAFRFREDPEAPSLLDLQFIVRDTLYRFGLVLDDERIIEEWLIVVNGGREKTIYERKTDARGRVTVNAKGLRNADKKLRALATIGGPKEQSFLATIGWAMGWALDENDLSGPVYEVLDWFTHRMSCLPPDSRFMGLGYALLSDPDFQFFASEYLKASSTGVDGVHVSREEISIERLKAMFSSDLIDQLKDATHVKPAFVRMPDDDREAIIERAGENCYLLTIKAIHRHGTPGKIHLDFSEESDGTQRLLHLLLALYQLSTQGGTLVIDEVERSMHPLLTRQFMEFFFRSFSGDHLQLIVTTHESNLLNQQLLRRDEIWFAEKNDKGATSLYSLADFRPRKDLKLDKNYLQGRFGAVPHLAEMDRIMKEAEGAHAHIST